MKIKGLALVLFSLVLVACASSGRKVDPVAASKIEKGKTTRSEVVALIGSPDQVSTRAGGDTVFSYNYTRVSSKPQNFIPVFGPLVGGMNVQNQFYIVTFGPDGVVKDYFSTYGSTDVDRGLATGGRATIPDVEHDKRAK